MYIYAYLHKSMIARRVCVSFLFPSMAISPLSAARRTGAFVVDRRSAQVRNLMSAHACPRQLSWGPPGPAVLLEGTNRNTLGGCTDSLSKGKLPYAPSINTTLYHQVLDFPLRTASSFEMNLNTDEDCEYLINSTAYVRFHVINLFRANTASQ
jgi:hypothetical protein